MDTGNSSSIDTNDTRKTRLTLDRLNKLRIMNDVRKLEHEKKLDKVSGQYKQSTPAGSGLPQQ